MDRPQRQVSDPTSGASGQSTIYNLQSTIATILPRLIRFVLERFPPHLNGVFGIASFFSLYLLWQAIHGRGGPVRITPGSIVGAGTITGMLLFLRVCDEMKDQEADRTLFPDRPLAAGRVTRDDLRVLAIALATGLTTVNAFLGWVAGAFLVLLVYSSLMFKWFFLPQVISKNLLLALVTHQPYIPISSAYVACVAARDLGGAAVSGRGVLAILAFWAPFLGWEIARKIRAPGCETEYETYSKVLGPRAAAALCAALVAAAATALAAAFGPIGVSLPFTVVGGLVAAFALGRFGAFIAHPTEAGAKLEPVMDAVLLVLNLGVIAEVTVRRGVVWMS